MTIVNEEPNYKMGFIMSLVCLVIMFLIVVYQTSEIKAAYDIIQDLSDGLTELNIKYQQCEIDRFNNAPIEVNLQTGHCEFNENDTINCEVDK